MNVQCRLVRLCAICLHKYITPLCVSLQQSQASLQGMHIDTFQEVTLSLKYKT